MLYQLSLMIIPFLVVTLVLPNFHCFYNGNPTCSFHRSGRSEMIDYNTADKERYDESNQCIVNKNTLCDPAVLACAISVSLVGSLEPFMIFHTTSKETNGNCCSNALDQNRYIIH